MKHISLEKQQTGEKTIKTPLATAGIHSSIPRNKPDHVRDVWTDQERPVLREIKKRPWKWLEMLCSRGEHSIRYRY